MLELIGASKWYDSQIEVAKRTVFTKQKKLVDEKGAAMHVLGRITNEPGKRKAINNQFSRGKRGRLLVKKLGLGIIISPNIWSVSGKLYYIYILTLHLGNTPREKSLNSSSYLKTFKQTLDGWLYFRFLLRRWNWWYIVVRPTRKPCTILWDNAIWSPMKSSRN